MFSLDTPENVTFNYQVAGIGSRFLATLVDFLIQGTLTLFVLVGFGLALSTPIFSTLPRLFSDWAGAILIIGLFLVQFGYFIFFEIFTGGQSPGKRLLNLRVVKENGFPLTALDSIVRNLVRMIDFLPIFYGVGIIVMFFSARAKRLGDYAAGTLVVKVGVPVELAELRPVLATPVAPPAAAAQPVPGSLRRLKPGDIQLIESYFQRRAQFDNPGRIAASLARTIRARLDDSQEPPTALPGQPSDEAFLRLVLNQYQNRSQK